MPRDARGRRYPRQLAEASAGAEAGDRRAVGLARLVYLHDGLRDLEEKALGDLGGEEAVSVLRREVLAIGLAAEGIALALLAEIQAKAEQSRRAGRVPHVSRYRATACVGTFLDLAARRFREVGLERHAKKVQGLGDYLSERATAGRGEASARPQPPTPATEADRTAAASAARETAPGETAP
jgi:hypothetical protein